MKFICLHIIIFLISSFTFAQELLKAKQTEAVRIAEEITIDGELKEAAWTKVQVAKDFITYDPTTGEPASENTEVKIIYDNEAIYIGAILYDKDPYKILREYTRRDETNANADAFWVSINPYADGQNVFQFQVTSVNVQSDLKIFSGGSDYNWNSVWFSETKITDQGWVVEIKIPYSAIRLPKTQEQVWDVNFWRLIRRIRETSSWNFVDKKLGNSGAQTGKLKGIRDIKSPLRLSLFPYVSAYTQHNSDMNQFSYSFIGGMDVKYGINESFTLDMTLIPDFGQTKSDDKVLNLSPYEIRYTENRQFFTEGTEMFNKAGLFYSRRIGETPSGYSDVDSVTNNKGKIIKNPSEAKLINATKISGRNKNNLGLGFFNAMTGNTYATVEDSLGTNHNLLTEPFTNYNIIVADQAFRKNSFVNIINTNMYQYATDNVANVTGATFRIYEKRDLYALYGTTAVSIKKNKSLHENSIGELYNLNAGKLNGNFTFNYGINIITDRYNPNDMAYLNHNNDFSQSAVMSYRIYKPFWKLLGCYSTIYYNYKKLYKPNVYTGTDINLESGATFKNYLSIGLNFSSGLNKMHDYFEARVPNRLFIKSRYDSFSSWLSTDYRKAFALDITSNGFISEWNNRGLWGTIAPRIRLSDHFLFVYSLSHGSDLSDRGYVSLINSDSIVFGKRNIRVITNSFAGTYVFNNKTYLSLNIRHYWSTVNYLEYFLLADNGDLEAYDYSGNHDINYNIFTIDMTYSWNFAPGSFINVMWKNNITKSENVFNNHFDDFFMNFDRAVNFPQVNSLSVKLSYYVDYQYFSRKAIKK